MSNLNYKIDGKQITVTGTYKNLLKEIKEKSNNTNLKNNNTHLIRYTTNDDSSHTHFAGGTWEDVTNLKNLKEFKKQLDEFKEHKLEQKIMSKLDFSPKRRRATSEHDGDYDHDKRWEIKPFNSSRKEMLPINVIDINVDMSISAGMSADSINKYGAMVWSVVQLIETLGIQCNITIINDSTNTSVNDHSAKLVYTIKKSGEYISPVALATTFQSVFYRRAIFAGIVLACDEFKKEVEYSLGRPRYKSESRNIWFENGAVYTRAGGSFKIEEVEKCITSIVKGK